MSKQLPEQMPTQIHKLILASESPRRKALLEKAGFLFRVFSVKVSENIEKNLTTEDEINSEILRIARTKAQAAVEAYNPLESGQYLILSADTLVIFQNRPLGKPKDSTEAQEFLSLLSGHTHQVKTAICLLEAHFENNCWQLGRQIETLETTAVTFRPISRQEILDYISTGEPMDKAGAYAIQGLGGKFVSSFVGPYDSVIGLPVETFKNLLFENKIEIAHTLKIEQIISEIKNLAVNPRARLVAVSKLQSIEKILDLAKHGQTIFAENYVQEALGKIQELQRTSPQAAGLQWHFIGRLQKNKIKMIVGNFELIHSVDSIEIAQKISEIASTKKIQQKILLQINLANEDSKGGFSESEFKASIRAIQGLAHIEVLGLMTMPPLFDDPEKTRPYFKRLRDLAAEYSLPELSMGTSSDYRVALAEGATLLRLGTVLFGERSHKIG